MGTPLDLISSPQPHFIPGLIDDFRGPKSNGSKRQKLQLN